MNVHNRVCQIHIFDKKIYIYSLSILKYIIQIEIYIYFKQFKNTI
jgi:hypothetical protein